MESNEENEYRNKLTVLVESLSDKMAVLEARDRLMRLKRMRQTDLATAVAVVGTCPDMCPELERYFRQETNQMSLFEMDANTGRPDEHRMVKEYRRSGADQEEPLAHELRPTPVLNRTMDYLCANIMDALDINTSCGEWYDFVWSRTRSIRKDITQQHLCDQQVVALTEKCARFHIHCSATLCEQNVKDFDPKINEENLSNCLQSLKDLYYDLSLRDIYCCNEPEFRCYEILLHLNDTAILKDVQNYRQQIRDSKEVQIAIKAFFAYQSNNYIKFFQLLDQCSYLMACILHRYFTPIRQKALKILRKCYTSNPSSVQEYPTQTLINCLGFEDSDELKAFCDHIGLECGQGIVYLIRGQNQSNPLKAKRSLRLIENKRTVTVGEVINGCPLPPNPYKTIAVHNSFDSEGRLKTDAIEAVDQKNKTISFSEFGAQFKDSNDSNQKTDRLPIVTIFGSVTPQSTPFSLNINSWSFPPDPNSTYVSNNVKTKLYSKTSNEIQNAFSDSFPVICDNICEDIISEVVEDQLTHLCLSQIEKMFNQILEQTICDIFSDIFLNTSDQMIKEISLDVIRKEIEIKMETIKIVDYLSDNIFDDLIVSEIKLISNEILRKSKEEYIEKENILFANKLLNDIIEEMVKDIASAVLSNETHKREELIRLIREKRVESLQIKYFFKWKDWFLRKKRLKYWSQSFPAAPKWTSNNCSPNNILYNLSDLSFDETFNKSMERQRLANDLLNIFIDTVIKEITSEAFQLISPKTQFFYYFQQKRLKRIERKYFSKWKHFCGKKRQHLKRSSFPAAPNWTHNCNTNQSIETKHTISPSEEESQSSIKRMRLQSCAQHSPKQRPQLSHESNECLTDSVLNIKPLFENELTESREFTQRLTQEINCRQNIEAINKFEDKRKQLEEYEEEDDIQVIEIFESETDKINRLKRLLSEERDYFSLHNFVQYLNQNK